MADGGIWRRGWDLGGGGVTGGLQYRCRDEGCCEQLVRHVAACIAVGVVYNGVERLVCEVPEDELGCRLSCAAGLVCHSISDRNRHRTVHGRVARDMQLICRAGAGGRESPGTL